jgi:hypothetical protein
MVMLARRRVQQMQTALMQMVSVRRAQTLLKLDLKIPLHRFRTRVVNLQMEGSAPILNMGMQSTMRVLPRALRERSVVLAQDRTLPVAVVILFAKGVHLLIVMVTVCARAALKSAAAAGARMQHSRMGALHSIGFLGRAVTLAASVLSTHVDLTAVLPWTPTETVRVH